MLSNDIGKTLIYIGLALVVLGLIVHFGGKYLPLGRLPGDFKWESGSSSVYFPLGTCIVLSIVLSVLANIFFRR